MGAGIEIRCFCQGMSLKCLSWASLLETSEKPVILPELSEGQETESFIPWLKEAFGCEIPTLQLHLLRS